MAEENYWGTYQNLKKLLDLTMCLIIENRYEHEIIEKLISIYELISDIISIMETNLEKSLKLERK